MNLERRNEVDRTTADGDAGSVAAALIDWNGGADCGRGTEDEAVIEDAGVGAM